MDPLLRVMDDPFLESRGTKELGKPEKRERHSGKGAIAKGLRRLSYQPTRSSQKACEYILNFSQHLSLFNVLETLWDTSCHLFKSVRFS